MNFLIIGILLVLIAVATYFVLNYHPLRKGIYIRLHPKWKKMARIYKFSEEEELEEEKNPLISATVLRDLADVIWHEKNLEPPKALFTDLPHGTVVHINSKHVLRFIEMVLPHLKSKIVLLTGYDTVSPAVPGYEKIIENPNILHWFLQNYDLDPKYRLNGQASIMPLGFNFHKLDPRSDNTSTDMGLPSILGNQQLTMKVIRDDLPKLKDRPYQAYANFHLNMDTFLRDPMAKTRANARQDALDQLKPKPYVTFESKQIPRNEVWRNLKNYAFEVSPRGNGIDCHRTYEGIFFNTIPIIKTTSIDSLFEDLPVVIVNDWDEVTEENLKLWKKKYQDKVDGEIPEKLYAAYWEKRFRNFAE